MNTEILAYDIATRTKAVQALLEPLSREHGIQTLSVTVDNVGMPGVYVHLCNGLYELAKMCGSEVRVEDYGGGHYPERICTVIDGVMFYQLCDYEKPGVYAGLNEVRHGEAKV